MEGTDKSKSISSVIDEIRNDQKVSDRALVSRRILYELLETAVIDDTKRGLKGKKELEEIELIKYAITQLAPISDELFNKINSQHDNTLKGLTHLNNQYEYFLKEETDVGLNLEKSRIKLIEKVISQHPSKLTLVDFIGRMTDYFLEDKHFDLLTDLLFDFNPTLGYLVKQDNRLDISHVIEALTKINVSGDERPIVFCKESELSKNLMQQFIYACWNNDQDIDHIERVMIDIYGGLMFGYAPEDLIELEDEMHEENKIVEMFSTSLKDLEGYEPANDLEEKVKDRIMKFIGVTKYAFKDNQFTPQEEEICSRVAKYFGIRTEEGYNNIINYCKKKVVIANGSSQVSTAIAKMLDRTAVSPITISMENPETAAQSIIYDSPRIVIVDLDNKHNATNLIAKLLTYEFRDKGGKIYGITKNLRPGQEKEKADEYFIDSCFSTLKVRGKGSITEQVEKDLGIKQAPAKYSNQPQYHSG